MCRENDEAVFFDSKVAIIIGSDKKILRLNVMCRAQSQINLVLHPTYPYL